MENTTPLVSIIVPCYKQSHLLDETLDSVMNQIFSNWECIIVNDGSPDNTEEVAKRWCDKDSRFSYIWKSNAGLPAARNTGIKESHGIYILVLDSDDVLHQDYLLKTVAVLEEKDKLGIVSCNRYFFREKKENIIYEHKPSGSSYRDLMFENILMPSSLYRKKCWEEVGGYDETMIKGFEDWEFWIAVTKRGWKFEIIDEFLFYYRKAEQSMLIDTLKYHRIDLLEFVMNKHQEIYLEHFNNTKTYLFFLTRLYRNSEIKYKYSLEYKLGKLIMKPFKLLGLFKSNTRAAS
ncbi:glycosyl transferase family 2 [Nonlabens dokdonensis]|uniref:Glycosyl transferase family 2 n=1 Tax=Nonlabens dokdonensis TaxID=328515 RepID=A0A1Z8B7V7_9FLAO|nr:glycosyltransferase family A protein [Nonlabens dokdonensis]OUS18684.1 glycosyl transferase family 2 [Nonlabens dokdonensis]